MVLALHWSLHVASPTHRPDALLHIVEEAVVAAHCLAMCVAARSVEDAHRKRGEPADGDGPEIHLDYCFIRNRPAEETITVLAGKDRKTKCYVAHVVPGKGAKSDWIAVQMVRDQKVTCVLFFFLLQLAQ